MTVSIEISNEQLAALKAKAAAHGLSLQDWLRKLAFEAPEPAQPGKPFKSGYGMLPKYGPAPSAEEIDENRREMFSGFAEEGNGSRPFLSATKNANHLDDFAGRDKQRRKEAATTQVPWFPFSCRGGHLAGT
jgi:hypothetical protein